VIGCVRKTKRSFVGFCDDKKESFNEEEDAFEQFTKCFMKMS
jgi:predicted AAA+ superfamily ATPase